MAHKVMFLDGFLVPAKKPLVNSLSPGILEGKGVFETMRSYNGKIFALDEHINRMSLGLKSLNISLPLPEKQVKAHIYRALSSNRLKNARVRLTVWQSPKAVRLSIIVLAYRPYPPPVYRRGFKAMISNVRYDRKELSSYVKSINYLSLMAASRQARKSGNDEALVLNAEGYLSEGSRTNVFFIKGKTLYTPSLACGCLRGITRQKVIAIAKALKLQIKQGKIRPARLFGADEAFVVNSLIEIMPLTFLQGKKIGPGIPGPWTEKILKSYKKLVLHETGKSIQI